MTVTELMHKLTALHGDPDLRLSLVDLLLVGPKAEAHFEKAEIQDVSLEGGHVVITAVLYDASFGGQVAQDEDEPAPPTVRPS